MHTSRSGSRDTTLGHMSGFQQSTQTMHTSCSGSGDTTLGHMSGFLQSTQKMHTSRSDSRDTTLGHMSGFLHSTQKKHTCTISHWLLSTIFLSPHKPINDGFLQIQTNKSINAFLPDCRLHTCKSKKKKKQIMRTCSTGRVGVTTDTCAAARDHVTSRPILAQRRATT